MIPPKPQNLSSSTISRHRRSYHWIFEDGELDLSISRNRGTRIDVTKTDEEKDALTRIADWMEDPHLFVDFLKEESKELIE